MLKFNVGDEVRCIKGYYNVVKINEIKIVLKTRKDAYIGVMCSCCKPSKESWLNQDYFELSDKRILSELFDDPTAMFKFIKRQLDISY